MLRLEALGKRFGETPAVIDLTLEVRDGELLTLLGPSGCGKTTTLRMIAGFEIPDAGRILLAGRDITREPPRRRGVGMVFQNYALFPHLDVFENVAFGLRVRGVSRGDADSSVEHALDLVDLAGYGGRKVQELSGGQQQRVALARALAPEPPVLLLDEPLSNLDPALRERTRDELRRLLERLRITTIFVTHDQEEAFALSDRVALMREGRLQQLGTPEDLYDRPANPFVASFLGRANFLDAAVVAAQDGRVVCDVAGVRWNVGAGDTLSAGDVARLMLRPEALRIRPEEEEGLPGEVVERRFAGAVTHYRVRTSSGELLVLAEADAAAIGERVAVQLPAGGALAFRARPAPEAASPTEQSARAGAAEAP